MFFIIFSSFWGKSGKRQSKPQNHVIQTAHQLFGVLDEPAFDICTVRVCTEDVMEVVTTQAEEEYQKSSKTNVFVAVFTTAHARLKLYEALETLRERVLYYDTDCGVLLAPWAVADPAGSFLGEFTDELDGDPIVEFVSGGAKNYGYLTRSEKTECKVRGSSLNYKTKQTLNYLSMKENILKEL